MSTRDVQWRCCGQDRHRTECGDARIAGHKVGAGLARWTRVTATIVVLARARDAAVAARARARVARVGTTHARAAVQTSAPLAVLRLRG